MLARHRRSLYVLLLVSGLAVLGRVAVYRSIPEPEPDLYPEADASPDPWENPLRRWTLQTSGQQILSLHRKKEPPSPGDWLARNAEAGQTFTDYRQGHPNRPSERLTTLYIQPWGEFNSRQTQLIADTEEYLAIFFGIPVKTRDCFGLEHVPSYARPRHPDRDDERLTTPFALDFLRTHRPKDAVALLGLTPVDLTPREGRSWVFGQASLTDRVGIWSLFRQGNLETEPTTVLRRTLQTAAHETGHMLGIRHCTAFECGMNGSSSREEADTRPLAFCPECEKKVWWACGVDPKLRYVKLATFAGRHGLKSESHFWLKSLALLEGQGQNDRLSKSGGDESKSRRSRRSTE